MPDRVRFPHDFLWGAGTAAYQIEGAAREGGRGESIWDRFSHTPGKTANGDTGDVAVDHYHRWQGDIAIMREVGLGAYRFSTAWSRILPAGYGQVNRDGFDFYDRLVDGLLADGIEPWITLFHWDLPQALEDRGGWVNRDTIEAFAEYTDVLTRRLGDRVKRWVTINEPWAIAHLGYTYGAMAPGRQDLEEALQVAHALLVAHGRAVEVVRGSVPEGQVGVALDLSYVYPETDREEDIEAAHRMDGFVNRWFLDALYRGGYPDDILASFSAVAPEADARDFDEITRPTDFLGISSYGPHYATVDPGPFGAKVAGREGEHTATGWIVEPKGLADLLVRVQRDYDPAAIYITGNGAAFDDPAPVGGRVADRRRIDYLQRHLLAAHEAMEQGVALRGYFLRSLLDGFEWADGYTKRFGITHVDYETQERTIKESGRWYADVIRENGVPVE